MTKYNILVLLLIVAAIGCNQSSSSFTIIASNNEKIIVRNFNFYETSDNAVYLYVINKKERDYIMKMPIHSMEFNTRDTTYIGKSLNVFYSRETDFKPFVFEVNNVTKEIVTMNIEGKEMFFMGMKNDIEQLFYDEVVKYQ